MFPFSETLFSHQQLARATAGRGLMGEAATNPAIVAHNWFVV